MSDQPYVNLFGEDAPEPGVKAPRTPRRAPGPTAEPYFVVGAVRYEKLDVVWMSEDGPVKLTLTARAAQAMLVIPPRQAENPAEMSARTAKAPHVRGSATSKAAAEQVTRRLAGKRMAVLQTVISLRLRDGGGYGFTDNELTAHMVQACEWSPNTARPRRTELARDGWLEDSGERRAGSIVWRPTQKAWDWWHTQQNGGAE